jgi:hypothetical protein
MDQNNKLLPKHMQTKSVPPTVEIEHTDPKIKQRNNTAMHSKRPLEMNKTTNTAFMTLRNNPNST